MWDSRIYPTTLAYINMFGDYEFNATPMGPPGTKVVTHKKNPDQDPHGHMNAPLYGMTTRHCISTGVTTSLSKNVRIKDK